MADIKGLMVATPTPFRADGSVDFDWIGRHLAFLRERGADGVVVCGTNGEGQSMSLEERKAVFEVVAASRGSLSFVAGTGCAALPETIELTQAARRARADAVMIIPPFLFKRVSADGLYNYYASILRAVDIPVFLYNIPQVSAIEISDGLVERLLEFPNLIGIKDSAGDADRTRRYCENFPTLDVFYGDDALIRPLSDVAKGGISGIANCLPELVSEAMRACAAGDGAAEQERVNTVARIFERYPVFAANKVVLSLRGFELTHVRPPLVDLSDEQRSSLERDLRSEGLL